MKHSILLLAFVTIFTIQCRKDDDDKKTEPTVYSEENPLAKFHENAGFTSSSNFVNAGDYEFGLVFSPNVKGKINAIVAKLPDVNNNLKVTIWDYDSKSVLRYEVISISNANTVFKKDILPLSLEKDKKYLITMNSNDWYKRSKPDNSKATYPITAGNIKFWEYRWVGTDKQIFPTNISQDYNGGDLSFNFQQTE